MKKKLKKLKKFLTWMDERKGITFFFNKNHSQEAMIISQHSFDDAYVQIKPELLLGCKIEYLIESREKFKMEIDHKKYRGEYDSDKARDQFFKYIDHLVEDLED